VSEAAHDGDELSRLRDAVAEREAELAEREKVIASLRELVQSLEGKTGALESSLINHAAEIELLKRKLFGAKSERGGTNELQLLLGDILPDLAPLQRALDAATPAEPKERDNESKAKTTPKGRRDLSVSKLPKIVVDIEDPELAAKGRRIGFDETYELMYVRGGFRVLVKRTAKYEHPTAEGPSVLGVEAPTRLFPRSLCHTSVFAWLAVEKFALGVPHHRLEQHLSVEAESLDRGTMCRYMEDLGGTLGATVVRAMFDDARANCQVLSTDATGGAIQPGARVDGVKQVCKKGHFFTVVADCDHVLYEFTSSHSSEFVRELFKGFKGLLQTDASSVYDILERGPPNATDETLTLVGCWAHCRRYFFEAAVCKYKVGLEGLHRIRALYAADNQLRDLPPRDRKERRLRDIAPLIDDFFAWVATAKRSEPGRTLATKALGYATNQEQELRRILLDGRLPLDNTRSERALRKIVVGRKNWLFYGSEIHAESAAAIFSIIASCRLHSIDPLDYLCDVLRVLPFWPHDRYIELSPLRWTVTRAQLDARELDAPAGPITVPTAS
jgi:transposase